MPNFINGLKYSILFLGFIAGHASAGNVNFCSQAGQYSISQAQDAIIRGDEALRNVPDCSRINWQFCQEAEMYYRQAAQHLEQVLFDAKGEACVYCDISWIGDFAAQLHQRQTQMQYTGYDTTFANVGQDYVNWKDAPYCAGVPGASPPPIVGQPPLPPVAAAPLPPAVRSCAPISLMEYARLDTDVGTMLLNTEFQACTYECEANQWCKSFDYDWGTSTCILRDVNMHDVTIEIRVPDFFHYQCDNRQ